MFRFSATLTAFASAVLASGCGWNAPPDFTGIDPNILQLRILANRNRHVNVIDAALKQQLSEEAGNKPWSDTVRMSTDSAAPVALWMEATDKAFDNHSSNRSLAFRKKPSSDATKSTERQVLVVLSPHDINRHDIARVQPGLDDQDRPAVVFTMTGPGAEKLTQLTANNLPDAARQQQQLGIFVDGVLYSAPSIMSVISDRGQITGDYTQQEVDELVAVLSVAKVVKADGTKR